MRVLLLLKSGSMKLLELSDPSHHLCLCCSLLICRCCININGPTLILVRLHLLLLMVKHENLRWRQVRWRSLLRNLLLMRLVIHFVYSPLYFWAWLLSHSLLIHLIFVLQSIQCIVAILSTISLWLLDVAHRRLNYLSRTIVTSWSFLNSIDFGLSPCLVLLSCDVSRELWVSYHILLCHSAKHLGAGWRLSIKHVARLSLKFLLSNIHLLLSQ